jgi:hypothetical protein
VEVFQTRARLKMPTVAAFSAQGHIDSRQRRLLRIFVALCGRTHLGAGCDNLSRKTLVPPTRGERHEHIPRA